jgi:hypothetical protein
VGGAAGTPGSDNTILLDRVRKLMDKAQSTSNSHEAEAFARKAAELIARHRLDPDRIATGVNDELGIREIPIGRGAYVRARLALLAAVVTAHDAQVVFASTPDGTIAYVAGFEADLDVIGVMYHSLHGQACTQMASQRRGTAAATQRYRRSFLFGYADRLAELLAESRRAAEGAATTSSRGSALAPALLARQRRVEAFTAERFGRVRSARAPGAAQEGGWVAGAAAAERADVGRARLAGRRALGRG